MSKAKLDANTLRHVGRELITLAEAFYQSPSSLLEFKKLDRTRGDILSAWGRIYLARGNRLARQRRKESVVIVYKMKAESTPRKKVRKA